ncbi:MAG TPA: type II secretion system protein GspK [Candidatus Hydrogenedentes bacterium]|nr:type II secretion system protein GspK [Candidatus Hydrogenedentota bacterium]HRT19528.1 type II secretion system protein GspK [Candidatus Hydrogenedentota bacterium]HRT64216.1 type II secretion system protein GspK [Candidatus Hydrogenedentota bacterium]
MTSPRGFVLVTVLWVLAILSLITIGFGRRAMLDRKAATYTLDHDRAMYRARGAVERGIAELRNKAIIDALNMQQGRTSYAQSWSRPVDMLAEGVYFEKTEGADNKKEERDVCRYRIRDEESLICINGVDDTFLTRIKALTPGAVRKIMRRRGGDPDTNEPGQGFQTIEELRTIEGIDDKDWFGDDDSPGLRDLMTCWGDGKININTASPEVLKCIPDVHDNVVEGIIAYRAGSDGELYTADDQDFPDLGAVANLAGISGQDMQPLVQYCKVDSQFFTIHGIATFRQGKVRATCVATVVMNPPYATVIKWREEFLGS